MACIVQLHAECPISHQYSPSTPFQHLRHNLFHLWYPFTVHINDVCVCVCGLPVTTNAALLLWKLASEHIVLQLCLCPSPLCERGVWGRYLCTFTHSYKAFQVLIFSCKCTLSKATLTFRMMPQINPHYVWWPIMVWQTMVTNGNMTTPPLMWFSTTIDL